MKNPYRLRWEPNFFVRAIIFGVLFLAFQLVLNYLKRDKIMEYDMVFWNSFFTIAMTYCAYAAQIVYSDYKEIAFALVVWGVCRVVCSLTKEKE